MKSLKIINAPDSLRPQADFQEFIGLCYSSLRASIGEKIAARQAGLYKYFWE